MVYRPQIHSRLLESPVFSVGDGSLGGGTFTRASGATRFDQRGYIEEVGADVARWEYDPVLTYNQVPDPWGATQSIGAPTGSWAPITGGLTATISWIGLAPDGLPSVEYSISGNSNGNDQTIHVAFGNPPLIPALPSDGPWCAECGIEVLELTGAVEIRHWLSSVRPNGGVVNSNAFYSEPILVGTPYTRYQQNNRLLINYQTAGVTTGVRVDVNGPGPVTGRIRITFPILNRGTTPLSSIVPLSKLAERRNGVAVYGLRGLLLEGSGENKVLNPRMEGAVDGSPGTVPSNHGFISPDGTYSLTRTINVGVEDGLSYVDYTWSGTADETNNLFFILVDPSPAAAAGQTWTGSVFCKVFGSALPASNIARLVEVGASVFTTTDVPFSSGYVPLSNARRVVTRTLTDGQTNAVRFVLVFGVTAGQTYDFTIRVAGAQLEQWPFPTSLVLPSVGSPSVSIRAANVFTVSWSSVAPSGNATILMTALLTSAGIGIQTLFGAHQNSNTNRFTVRLNAGNLALFRDIGGNGLGTGNTLSGLSGATALRCGLAVSGEKMTLFAAGGSLQSIATATPVVTLLQVGARNNNLDPMFGTVPVVRVLPYAVSDAMLQTLVNALPVPT